MFISPQMVTKGQKKKPPDLQVISGCFNGINGVLSSFSDVVPEATMGEIFRFLVLCCNPNVRFYRYFSVFLNSFLERGAILPQVVGLPIDKKP